MTGSKHMASSHNAVVPQIVDWLPKTLKRRWGHQVPPLSSPSLSLATYHIESNGIPTLVGFRSLETISAQQHPTVSSATKTIHHLQRKKKSREFTPLGGTGSDSKMHPSEEVMTYLDSRAQGQECIPAVAHLEDAAEAVLCQIPYLQYLQLRRHGAEVELGDEDVIDDDGRLRGLVERGGEQVASALVKVFVGGQRRPVEVEGHRAGVLRCSSSWQEARLLLTASSPCVRDILCAGWLGTPCSQSMRMSGGDALQAGDGGWLSINRC